MNKRFFKFSLSIVIASSLLSVLFSAIYFIADGRLIDGSGLLTFLAYIKKAFDLVSLFIGFGTVIYAFSYMGIKDGMYSFITVLISTAIYTVWLIVSISASQGVDFSQGAEGIDLFFFTIYYSFGESFITQFAPALLFGLIAYKITKSESEKVSKFISTKNTYQKSLLIIVLAFFAFEFILLLSSSVLPFLISAKFYITKNEFVSVIRSITECAVSYLIVQYLVYMFSYKIYSSKNFNDNLII